MTTRKWCPITSASPNLHTRREVEDEGPSRAPSDLLWRICESCLNSRDWRVGRGSEQRLELGHPRWIWWQTTPSWTRLKYCAWLIVDFKTQCERDLSLHSLRTIRSFTTSSRRRLDRLVDYTALKRKLTTCTADVTETFFYDEDTDEIYVQSSEVIKTKMTCAGHHSGHQDRSAHVLHPHVDDQSGFLARRALPAD